MNFFGKLAAVSLVASGVIAAGALWYSANYAYWEEDPRASVALQDTPDALKVTDLQAIRSSSSPLGFRACFTYELAGDPSQFTQVTNPEPRVPPRWFECFDTAEIAEALANRSATTYVSHKNIGFGVDRVIALFEDGRGFAWHELNDCGHRAYDGTVVGEACPDRATFQGSF